ncbi:MAG: ureidoglycolate lyase [Alphaproteobacteria bacterium]
MTTLKTEPLSAEAFAPFGDVFQAPAQGARLDRAETLSNRRGADAAPCLLLATLAPSALPLEATLMERHPHSSQTFVPMAGGRYLVMVAPHAVAGGPDMARARAFIASPGQGVTYRPDTWHHGATVLDRDTTFAVFMWNDGSDDDTEFLPLDRPVTVAG